MERRGRHWALATIGLLLGAALVWAAAFFITPSFGTVSYSSFLYRCFTVYSVTVGGLSSTTHWILALGLRLIGGAPRTDYVRIVGWQVKAAWWGARVIYVQGGDGSHEVVARRSMGCWSICPNCPTALKGR